MHKIFNYIVLIIGRASFLSHKNNLQQWEYLDKSCKKRIEVIAPSWNFGNLDFIEIEKELKSILFNYNIASDLFSDGEDFDHSNSLDYRIQHLYNSFIDPNISCIWAISGGRGANEIFSNKELWLELKKKLKNMTPKILIGFSDFTAVLLYATTILDWPVIYGVNLGAIFKQDLATRELYYKILRGEIRELNYTLQRENDVAKNRKIKSSIIGGNLTLIGRSFGTIRQPITKNKIVFLEVVRTPCYEVDEQLIHLELAGYFDGIDAVILGFFGPTKDVEGVKLARKKFINRMTKKNVPVFSSNDFGHGDNNYPLPLNTEAVIDENGRLSVKTNRD